MNHENIEKAVTIRMLRDPSFKRKLLNNPKAAIQEFCQEDPDLQKIDFNTTQIRVEHEKKNEWVLVIPWIDDNASLSDRDLEKLAAGGSSSIAPTALLCHGRGPVILPI